MITEVAALLGALRTSNDILKVAIDARDQAVFHGKLIELQQAILAAQGALPLVVLHLLFGQRHARLQRSATRRLGHCGSYS